MNDALRALLAGAVLFCTLRAHAQIPDIGGTWVAEQATPVGGREMVFRLKQAGVNITGSQALSFGTSPIVDGELHGDQFSFSVQFDLFGPPRTLSGAGRIFGDTLLISPALPPTPSGPVTAAMTFKRGFPTGNFAVDPMDYRSLPTVLLPALRAVSYNGLAKTPPMGWNSWNKFDVHVSDSLVREMADAMVASGMKAAGYSYINIDDGWQGARNAHGVLEPNAKFPDMRALARYVHARGLKLGLYASPGPRSCAGYEGSYGHEDIDARTWAAWGIDYLKYDWCSAGRIWREDSDMRAVYQRMGEALHRVTRRLVFSICQYGRASVAEWAPLAGGNLWRTSDDIKDSWERMSAIGFSQGPLARFAGPGHWNDPDMLEVGNGRMSNDEYRTHFSLWALLAAPLIAGNDLRDMAPAIKDILLNREVIAVDQDPLARPPERLSASGDTEIWVRTLRKGWAVALFNRGTAAADMSVKWADIGVAAPRTVIDVWAHAELSPADGFAGTVPPHGVIMLRVEP